MATTAYPGSAPMLDLHMTWSGHVLSLTGYPDDILCVIEQVPGAPEGSRLLRARFAPTGEIIAESVSLEMLKGKAERFVSHGSPRIIGHLITYSGYFFGRIDGVSSLTTHAASITITPKGMEDANDLTGVWQSTKGVEVTVTGDVPPLLTCLGLGPEPTWLDGTDLCRLSSKLSAVVGGVS